MSNSAHCDDLANRFAKKAEDGLIDVKFLVRNRDEATADEVCEEVNNLYRAMDDEKVQPLNFGDLKWRDA